MTATSTADADVLVIGAGSAGCVVAARMVELAAGRCSVALFEAGPDGRPSGVAGPNFLAALREPGRLWADVRAARTARAVHAPYLRGRGIGGSAAVNAMIGLWGSPDDDAAWRDVGGEPWRPDVLARLRERVAARLPLWRPPLDAWSRFEQRLAQAAGDEGYPWCADHNRPGAWGVGPAPLTVREGRRWSVVEAYLEPVRRVTAGRFQVVADATVDRLLIERGRVVGVRTADGVEHHAARAVVVCCGALHSPALLLRSGIERPGVGANLADHASAGFAVALEPAGRLPDPSRRPLSSLIRYTSGLAEAGSRDMELLPLGATGATVEGLGVASIQVAVMAPFSRGRVTLTGPGPDASPTVELNLLSDDRDLARLRDGLRRARRLLDHPAVRPIVAGVFVDDRGTPVERLDVEGVLEAWLAGGVGTYVHATGTCRIGRPDDPLAVVDPEGRVIGCDRLWVADASILPTPPRAGPHLSTVLVAESVTDRLSVELGLRH